MQKFGTFEGKQILPEKFPYIRLAPSHSFVEKKLDIKFVCYCLIFF